VAAVAVKETRVPRAMLARRGLLALRVRLACVAPREVLEWPGRLARSVRKAPWAVPESRASMAPRATAAVLALGVPLGTRARRVTVVSLALLASWVRREVQAIVAQEATRASLGVPGRQAARETLA
jgi:hypothetical protein